MLEREKANSILNLEAERAGAAQQHQIELQKLQDKFLTLVNEARDTGKQDLASLTSELACARTELLEEKRKNSQEVLTTFMNTRFQVLEMSLQRVSENVAILCDRVQHARPGSNSGRHTAKEVGHLLSNLARQIQNSCGSQVDSEPSDHTWPAAE